MAVRKRLPANSILLLIQNQRGGTVSAQPTIPTTRPSTALNAPTTSDTGEGLSNRYSPPRMIAIGLINWNIQRKIAMLLLFHCCYHLKGCCHLMTAPLPRAYPLVGEEQLLHPLDPVFLHLTPCLEQLPMLVFNSISFILK